MRISITKSAIAKPRAVFAFLISLIGIGLAALSFAAPASGVWAIAFSPTRGEATTYHQDVTCTATSDCWAVGYFYDNKIARPLFEHWNGTEWVVSYGAITDPNQSNTLFAVTCVAAADCWAVGDYYDDFSPYQTLVEHWNGSAWTIVTSPNTSTMQDNYLFAVSCTSASDCWAAGRTGPVSAYEPLLEHWDGTQWTMVSLPDVGAGQHSYFNGVTCASPTDCWTYGAYYIDSNLRHTLTEHWNGSDWVVVNSPNTSATEDNRLIGVACPSSADCWAVGFHTDSSNLRRTLTEHWDGNAWVIVTSANTSGTQDDESLSSVACPSSSDCWAVGSYYNGTFDQTLIEHWNGTAWRIITSPVTRGSQSSEAFLRGVTCASTSDCWAVGDNFWDNGNFDTGVDGLIEHYLTSNQLGNISTRLNVQTADNVGIAGFIITGQPQKVLIRALGPTIAKPPFNVPNTLNNPKLALFDQTQTLIASNNNWPNTIKDGTVITEDQFGDIYYSIYRPSSDNESVIIATLPAGNYTAIVSGVNNTSGVALVEVYNLTSSSSTSLANISTRGSVQTGDDVMIGGFIVSGAGSRTVVVRGLGPTLMALGVSGALGDPTLELRDGNGNLIASDDNWKDMQQAEIQSTGLAPPNDLEPAILATLPAANYTAILRGKNNTSGVALVETYITN